MSLAVLDTNRLAPRMWRHVDLSEWEADSNARWYWTAGTAGACRTSPDGYGRVNVKINGKRKPLYAHRFFYELLVGPIPVGYQINHLCRVTLCVNPGHLEAVTPSANTRYSKIHASVVAKNKTHCKHGHPFTGLNLILGVDGRRICRTCRDHHGNERYLGKRIAKATSYLEGLGYTVIPP